MHDSTPLPSRFALGALLAWLAITLMWWALAFAPLPVPEAWLAEARAVCFGTLSNGLPDSYGWVLLILGPLSMLGFLAVVWWRELVLDARWLLGRPTGIAFVALLVTTPLLGAGWVGHRVAEGVAVDRAAGAAPIERGLPETYPRTDRDAPPLELVDETGARTSLGDLAGEPVVVTFAYAHCDTVCPVVVETVRSAAESLGPAAPPVLVVTLDPWRDPPSRLAALASAWHLDELPRSHVLSGEVDEVLATLDAWEMPIDRDERTGEIAHPALVYVVDADGRLAFTFNNPPRAWVAEAIHRLRREAS